MNTTISTEMLNAYIDNELDDKEALNIEAELKKDSQLQNRLYKLQQVKLKVQASYASVRAPVRREERSKSAWLPTAIAASITLAIGMTSGWYGNQYVNDNGSFESDGAQLLGVKLQEVTPQDDKIIIHLAKNDKILFDKALAKAEALLERFDQMQQSGAIQVLANSNGMDILRDDRSPYKGRIVNLMQQYDNIQFIACENTIRRLKSNGQNVQLISGVRVNGPVINEIVSHMQDGWTYIKI